MKNLKNTIAIVSGAGSGIGKATALLLALEGAKVIVSDINEKNGNISLAEISNNGGEAFLIKADTSKPEGHKLLGGANPKKIRFAGYCCK